MKAVNTQVIQEVDRRAIEDFCFPRLILMENAGRLVAENCLCFFKPKNVILFCGAGFNGGDGLVAARYLLNRTQKVTVILTSGGDKLKYETRVNLEILKRLNVDIIELKALKNPYDFILKEKSDLLVDAMVGIGLKSQVEGFLKEVIGTINRKREKVVSVDIPSGLASQTGIVCGVCVKADLTVTFTFPKKGMYVSEGPKFCGRVKVVDIGIPQKIIKEVIRWF